jgi:hypothetical protein
VTKEQIDAMEAWFVSIVHAERPGHTDKALRMIQRRRLKAEFRATFPEEK